MQELEIEFEEWLYEEGYVSSILQICYELNNIELEDLYEKWTTSQNNQINNYI